MKKLYFSRQLLAFLCLLGCFSGNLFAQTMPTPQALPYTQNFNTLAATATAYPDGFQGWTASTSPGSAFNTSATLVADRALTASSSASITSGNFHNYNGKIGFLNSGSLDLTIAFAFSTTGQSAVQIQYDAMVIRNPYDGTNNTRINEMVLQYRVGQTSDFTTLPTTSYVSGTTLQTGSGVTTPQNPQTINVTLPADCDNQPLVQIRWISKQNGGGGSRPSFAIDNIKVGGDSTPPVNESGYPKAVEILSDGFDFINKINETGKTYFVLTASGSAQPTPAQVKAGFDATGVAALQSGSLTIADKSLEYSKIFTGLTLNTGYIVYSVSEDISENLQTTVNKLEVTTANALVPSIRTTTASLNFGSVEQNLDSASLNYQIKGTNISAPVIVTATANFTVSKDNTTFQSSVSYDAVDFASNATPTVYVRFKPSAAGILSGTITQEATGALSKTVAVSGIGTNPYIQNFDDPNVLSNSGWTQYNVSGPLNKWTYTNVTRNVNSGTGAVLMNGFSDTNVPSKDWLISPKLRLDSFGQFPLLSFYTRKFYAGPSLKLMVSTNYDGVSDPTSATWTEIDGNFPTVTGSYVKSEFINLGAYKTDHTYLAWVYETTAGGTNNASEWSFDDFAITNESGYVASNPVLDFGDVAQNTVSASQSFAFKADGYGDLTLTAPASYQLSLDNASFASSIVVPSATAAAGTTLYARFIPTTKELKISGVLTVTGTSLNKQIGSLTGSSLPKADTFDVVTYNLEFFGAPTSAYGPADKTLQLENVSKVMNKLDADVYVVQEVSSDAQIDALITKINVNGKTFEKSVSTSWSYSWDPTSDPTFPPQKLVVLYNTKTTTLKKTRVMFKEFYDELRAGTKTLANYPGGSSSSFFSSGRLPYMVTLETNLNGVKNEIKLIDLHARANSGTDISRYNMRKYDTQVLKDSLDAHYADSNIILLGDYNDDVKASVIAGQPSSYEAFVNDTNNYKALTLEISQAGAYSFLSSGGFLDHITISNELFDDYIANSTAVYDPRNDIASYTTTTSDHGPVIARFELKQDVLAVPDFGGKNKYVVRAYPNPATDVVNFDLQTAQGRDLKIKLYDINGHVIGNPISVQSESEISTAVMSVHNLVSGFYIYTVTENNKVIFKDKIIKK
ncbi:endonuclease/exonuclease/phosphatase family metal-dependent hydrolase [Flavobacterium nitrogenifigens]|uniref:Endonuclease/exonuclease/phosphatase family metal-dependent hydrolase n=2 Tax=Flavobacterium TaxID=237 RepID=A0A7W7J116_9FLAO|nr:MULTISPECIES: T9SS type A sorting domain-containing protein [Flavobacterium]MBB4804296.1 endonuclease/exonuclease/phosphatase family metal-dependent hydrolase [Flavobacterium nitrogenifigens]MBB6389308.1 endonuclease/exonuclease/phosphatase family metal-dependent hydrolase [Flavobacterium notoginsengisoli]